MFRVKGREQGPGIKLQARGSASKASSFSSLGFSEFCCAAGAGGGGAAAAGGGGGGGGGGGQ